MNSSFPTSRFQFGIRHLVMAVAVIAIGLALVDGARKPGRPGEGARFLFLSGIAVIVPYSNALAFRRMGQSPLIGGTLAGAVLGATVTLFLLGIAGIYEVTPGLWLLLLMTSVGGVWGLLIGIVVQSSYDQRGRWRL